MEPMLVEKPNDVKAEKGNRMYQYLAMIFGTMNIICSGMHYGWASPSLPELLDKNTTQIPITNEEGSWIAVMPLIGSLLGGFLGGLVLNYVGRKKVILFLSVPYLAAWLLIGFTQNVETLFVARFFAGISDGLGFCVIPMYLAEISDPEIRGIIGCSVAVASVLGIVIINLLGTFMNIANTALVSSTLPVVCFLSFVLMPESPYFHIMMNNIEKAKECLIQFKGKLDVQDDLDRMTKAFIEQKSSKGRLVDLFAVKSNRKGMFIAMGIRTTQQICGITAITFYAQTIFEQAGSVLSPHTASILYFTVQLICGTCCSFLVDRAGRKPLLIISTLGTSLALLVEAIFFTLQQFSTYDTSALSVIPIVALVAFIILFSIGLQSIPIMMMGELFPTNLKAYAIAFNDIYFCMVATISSLFFQTSKDTYGLYLPFYVFFVCSILGLVFIVFYVPETKQKTLEQIQQELKGEKVESSALRDVQEGLLVKEVKV